MKKFIIIVLLAIFVWFVLGDFKSGVKNNSAKTIEFEIIKGDNAWTVAKKLKQAKIIKSPIKFIVYFYRKNLHTKIKAGEYSLRSNLNISEIAYIITKGRIIEKIEQQKITFPEGLNISEYAQRITEAKLPGEEFNRLVNDTKHFQKDDAYEFLASIPKGKNLEGFLFPDTYFFSPKVNAETIIKKMLNNFDKKLSADLRDEIAKQGKTIYEIITMASILEKEVRTDEDKKMVSDIFWDRLERGQAFQSCATLAYILGENKKQYSYQDTKIDSPYNTYLHTGLPPGPISNPGLASILAAIYPTENEYNYFLSNIETGKTVFSRTIEEHNLNKVKNGL